MREIKIESDTQIFITTEFEITAEDFDTFGFAHEQIVKIGNGDIKILSNPLTEQINKNAIVIERKKKTFYSNIYRIYIMEKTNNIDIRDYFDKTYFMDKDELLKVLRRLSNDAFFEVVKEELRKGGD